MTKARKGSSDSLCARFDALEEQYKPTKNCGAGRARFERCTSAEHTW
jgi:hypothetical protein